MKSFLLIALCFAATLLAQAQKKQEVIDFIEKLPTIEYGVLPYWHGTTHYEIDDVNTSCFIHGYDYHEYDTINNLNNYLMKLALCDSSYIIYKGKKVQIEIENVEFRDKFNFGQGTYVKNHKSFIAEFIPPLYASAKSIFNDKYYIVYFWNASTTQSVYYYAIVFDKNGNLLSYQHFDYWLLGFAEYPFHSLSNHVRLGDYPKTMVTYLPNGLLLAKDPNTLIYGGNYQLLYLNKYGHYEIVKSWDEIGGLEEIPINDSKYVNYERVDLDDNNNQIRQLIQIPFVVHDKDGYANIRAEASGNAKVIRTINDGDMVWGTYLPNGWCKIAFTADSNGKIVEDGYIHSSRLEKISDPENDEFIKLPSREDWEQKIRK
jgi:hypothetical protein